MTDILQSDRDFVSDLLDEIGGYEIDSREVRDGRGDHKATVQMAAQRRLAILQNIKRNRIDGVASRLNIILNENEEALTVTVRGHIEAALRLCTLAALDSRAGDAGEVALLRTALHEIDQIAGMTIPPDGDAAAWSALDAIIRLIHPFRTNGAYPPRATPAPAVDAATPSDAHAYLREVEPVRFTDDHGHPGLLYTAQNMADAFKAGRNSRG